MNHRRLISLGAGGVLALAAVTTMFAGTALAVNPKAVVTEFPTFTAVPSVTPCVEPTPTPTQVVLTVVVHGVAAAPLTCPTPFESFQGETSDPTLTPPPTSTSGGSSGSDGSAPLFLMLTLALGSIGMAWLATSRSPARR